MGEIEDSSQGMEEIEDGSQGMEESQLVELRRPSQSTDVSDSPTGSQSTDPSNLPAPTLLPPKRRKVQSVLQRCLSQLSQSQEHLPISRSRKR